MECGWDALRGTEGGPLGVRVYTDGRCKTSEQGPLSYVVAVVTLVIYVRKRGGCCCTSPVDTEAICGACLLPCSYTSLPPLAPYAHAPCQVGWMHILLGLMLASFFSCTALLILVGLFSTLLLPARPVLWGPFTKASSPPCSPRPPPSHAHAQRLTSGFPP